MSEEVIKFRGIKTTQTPKYETNAKTVKNRFGQKSISLPRIDDKKRWAGYAGNTGISRKLAQLIPKCNLYCEPFAGTAKVWQELNKLKLRKYKSVLLNDRSEFIESWLKKEFMRDKWKQKITVSRNDFATCITDHDEKDTVFLIDPPWSKSLYDQVYSCFDRESVKSYDEELLEILKDVEGKFIVTSAKNNTVMKNSDHNGWYLKSEYVVSGNYPQQLITTNIKFTSKQALRSGLMLVA